MLCKGSQKPFRNDRNRKGGGLMIFVREDIPCKKINIDFPRDFECIALEINFRKEKWLFIGCYHLPKQRDEYFFEQLSQILDKLGTSYNNFLISGDFQL